MEAIKAKRGIIHVGAHLAEECDRYGDLNVLWIEANPDLFARLQQIILKYPKQRAVQALVHNVDGKELGFHIANQTARSSVLGFTDHHTDPSKVPANASFRWERTIPLVSKTLITILAEEKLSISDYDMLVSDVQGADLYVLQGLGDEIRKLRFVECEVMRKPCYADQPLEGDVSEYLRGHGFVLISDRPYEYAGTQRDNLYERRP